MSYFPGAIPSGSSGSGGGSGGGGAAGASGSFVFRPGETTSGNVYGSFAELAEALEDADGYKTVLVEADWFDVPPGSYAFKAALFKAAGYCEIYIEDGASFAYPFDLDGVALTNDEGAETVPFVLTDSLGYASAVTFNNSSLSGPLFHAASGQILIRLLGSSVMGNSGSVFVVSELAAVNLYIGLGSYMDEAVMTGNKATVSVEGGYVHPDFSDGGALLSISSTPHAKFMKSHSGSPSETLFDYIANYVTAELAALPGAGSGPTFAAFTPSVAGGVIGLGDVSAGIQIIVIDDSAVTEEYTLVNGERDGQELSFWRSVKTEEEAGVAAANINGAVGTVDSETMNYVINGGFTFTNTAPYDVPNVIMRIDLVWTTTGAGSAWYVTFVSPGITFLPAP